MNNGTYSPKQNGIPIEFHANVIYKEHKPSQDLSRLVNCFWTLRSNQKLDFDFTYAVMPDACVDLVFDVASEVPVLIMTPHVSIQNINLGTQFHYIGIRFKPGVFTGDAIDIQQIIGQQQDIMKIGDIDLQPYINNVHATLDTSEHITQLMQLTRHMTQLEYIEPNTLIDSVVAEMQLGLSQELISKKVGFSTRQLRRKVFDQTGFTPIQLQRVVRFQMTLSSADAALRFADQSHLIKEFNRITGYSYKSFLDNFSE